MWDPAVESRSRDELAPLILARLRKTLERCHANPAYARRLGEVEPGDIRSAADWGRLPFLVKAELRDAYPFGLACCDRADVKRIQMSSGTTGNPIVNPYTAADIDQWRDVMARCYAAAGVTARDVIHVTPSFGLFTGGFGFHYGAERIGASVIPAGPARTTLQLKLMKDLSATVLAGIATYPLRILEVAREEAFDLRALSLRVAILGSEMWSDDLRRLIERELSVETFDIIGMTETGGPGLGIDCEAHAGIHVWEDHYYAEIIDPSTGGATPDGTEGELVLTTLTRVGLPLVRYRTHDLTRIVSRDRCACGRSHLRLDRLRGRTDDMVIFKGTNFYPRQIESLIFQRPGVSHEYQIVLERGAGGDRLSVVVEVRPGFETIEADRLRDQIHAHLNLTAEIRAVPEGEIARPQAKAVRVVDRRAMST
jgi:phenylacetate-CoA ligase